MTVEAADPTDSASRSSSKRAPSKRQNSSVGILCRNVPAYVREPPIEAVVFGWGVSEDGQLGVEGAADVLAPKVIEALLGTRLKGRSFLSSPLVAGSRNTLAIDADGQLLSWGWNARGTLGHNHRGTERKPRRVAALKGVNILQTSIGGWHCLAVDDKGQAYAWGGNEYGQCGLDLPKRDLVVPTPCMSHLRIRQVAAGGMHSCALTETGKVWVWGEPWGEFSMTLDRKPRALPDVTGIAKIACGAFHNLALNRDGQVFAWGINDFGQLGNGTTFYETSPTAVVGLKGESITDIAAGGWHSLALTVSGEVYVWGRGEYGRLGLGDKSGSSRLRASKVRAMEGHKVVQASCGGTHTCVLTAEARLFTWGRGSFGRLGTNSQKDCYSPVEVLLPGGPERWRVISISCGGRHTLALALPDNGEVEDMLTKRASFRNRNTSSDAEEQVVRDILEDYDLDEEDDLQEGLELQDDLDDDVGPSGHDEVGVGGATLTASLEAAEREQDEIEAASDSKDQPPKEGQTEDDFALTASSSPEAPGLRASPPRIESMLAALDMQDPSLHET
ncbi:hypothetical protein WJX72_001724 [[Myrmecia] bisecta]|uniref:RCC1-like domain-containing protein n=1 Tax=[Myrmecia] bisecta TaxID=41462 RepID=A0AAW1QEA8_9CHLO